LPDGVRLRWQFHFAKDTLDVEETPRVVGEKAARRLVRELRPSSDPKGAVTVKHDLPAAKAAPAWEGSPVTFADAAEGSLERPGYRAIAYPRPKTVSGEDRVMPAAVAVRPRDGPVY